MTPSFGNLTAAIASALALGTSAAWSDDAALYDAPAPEDAVFVRVLAERSVMAAPVRFGGMDLPVNEATLDAYFAISAADLTGVAAGGHYSIAKGATGSLVIEEPSRENAAKVHLIVVNSGSEAVRLVVPDQGLEVVEPVEPGQASSRAVNPITVELAVERASDGTVLGTFDVQLARGRNLTFVAGPSSARMVENSVGIVLKPN